MHPSLKANDHGLLIIDVLFVFRPELLHQLRRVSPDYFSEVEAGIEDE